MSGGHRAEISLRPPGLAERVWCRRLGIRAPAATWHSGPWHAAWVRLLPYRWRWLHRAYAWASGYFWLPCPLCGRPFGGHEAGEDIPDPLRGPGAGICICSRCTRKRRKP